MLAAVLVVTRLADGPYVAAPPADVPAAEAVLADVRELADELLSNSVIEDVVSITVADEVTA